LADYLERSELNRQFAKQPEQTFKDFLNQYTANRRRWRKDGESIVELTSRNAVRWLKENHQEAPFFLHVEAFDPHEPWDPPQQFLEKYLKNAEGPSWPEPPLWPYILDEKHNKRDHLVQAFGWIAAVRTREWNYSAIWNREKYVGEYAPQLYDTRKDPQELKNVADQHPAVVKDLHAKLERYIASGWEITGGSFAEKAG
jgi:arylsulfatase A-like enzyme